MKRKHLLRLCQNLSRISFPLLKMLAQVIIASCQAMLACMSVEKMLKVNEKKLTEDNNIRRD